MPLLLHLHLRKFTGSGLAQLEQTGRWSGSLYQLYRNHDTRLGVSEAVEKLKSDHSLDRREVLQDVDLHSPQHPVPFLDRAGRLRALEFLAAVRVQAGPGHGDPADGSVGVDSQLGGGPAGREEDLEGVGLPPLQDAGGEVAALHEEVDVGGRGTAVLKDGGRGSGR